MNSLFILVSIAQSVASALLQNKGDPGKIAEWSGYLNLAAALAARVAASNTDLRLLDEQLQAAVAAGRGLTAAERAVWRARDDIATDVARKWLVDHPPQS